MKKGIIIGLSAIMLGSFTACESYLDIFPDDNITAATFWNEPGDATLALNGAYKPLMERHVLGYGPGYDAATPNAFQWAYWENMLMQIGNGTITPSSNYIVRDRWTFCYQGIHRVNYIFENIDNIPNMDAKEKERILGEAYFLRALYYDLMARIYGGVPIVTASITTEESKTLSRASIQDTWAQVHSDFDEAIKRLPVDGVPGQATLGSAYGLKMKAYLYTSQWDKVLEYIEKLEGLNKYKLYPSYQGLFQLENEGNDETVFALSFMAGPYSQGSVYDRFFQPQNLKYGIDGSNSVAPTQLLVDEYETLDGSPVDPANPFNNRDPRLDFTILRPGAYFQGQLYPDEIQNHASATIGYSFRKYTIETQVVIQEESPLDFMYLRYGDVLLCKAEALIETGQNIDGAIDIINRIRTERTDVKLPLIKKGLGKEEARKILRHERRIELAFEGQFWDDIKRWNAGPEYYPCVVLRPDGGVLDRKFPNGYDLNKDNLLPIHNDERAINPNLVQNPGY